MRKLKSEGLGIIFITHFLNQVYQVADRITVLRNGRLVGTYDRGLLPRFELVGKMLGRTAPSSTRWPRSSTRSTRTRAPSQSSRRKPARAGRARWSRFDLALRAREVVGHRRTAGLRPDRAGATALRRSTSPDSGRPARRRRAVEASFAVRIARNAGIALCPEDRKAEGIIGELTIRENIVLACRRGRRLVQVPEPSEARRHRAQVHRSAGHRRRPRRISWSRT